MFNVITGSGGFYANYFYPIIIACILAIMRMSRGYKGIKIFVAEVCSCMMLVMVQVALLIHYNFSAETCLLSGALTGLLGTKRVIRIAEVIILRRLR